MHTFKKDDNVVYVKELTKEREKALNADGYFLEKPKAEKKEAPKKKATGKKKDK